MDLWHAENNSPFSCHPHLTPIQKLQQKTPIRSESLMMLKAESGFRKKRANPSTSMAGSENYIILYLFNRKTIPRPVHSINTSS